MPRSWIVALALLGLVVASVGHVAAQVDKPVGNLRIAVDASGQGMALDPSSAPGERIYRLPTGIDQIVVAFDYQGTEPTDVAVRVIGPSGIIVFEEKAAVDEPGTHVIIFKQGTGPLADNEYVVNAYVGEEQYLADSLQLAVGEAVIAPSRMTEIALTPAATMQGIIPTAAPPAGQGAAPPNPFTPTLLLAVVGLLVLAGVVLWAVRSAMRSKAP